MSAFWQPWAQRFDALSLRERRLAAVAAALVASALVYAIVIAPSEAESRKLAKEREAAESQMTAQATQIESLQRALAVDPDAQRKAELVALEQQVATLDEELARQRPDLVDPRQMLALVRELAARRGAGEVVAIRALAPEAVRFERAPTVEQAVERVVGRRAEAGPGEAPPATATEELPAGPVLYRHAVELEVRGDYNTLLDYLRAVEALPARLRSGQLQIETQGWPQLHMRLRIHSLSLTEGAVGV